MTNSDESSVSTAIISTTGIDTEISSAFILDRYAGDVLTLPYEFNEVRIKSNELCIADNVNAALTKLYHNFLYINSRTKLADNNFPKLYKGFMASTSGTGYTDGVFSWYPSTSGADDIKTQLIAGSLVRTPLSGIVAGDFVKTPYTPTEYFGAIALSGTLIGVRSNTDDTAANINLRKTKIEDASGLTFVDIRSVRFNSDYNLIVIDDNRVHKLDLDPALTSNRAISGIGQFLINTIGGKSRDVYDKDKFNKPVDVAIGNNDEVYILDQDDYGIKRYDKDLNWIQTAARKNEYTALSGGKVVSLDIDPVTNYVYVLSDNGIIIEYTSDFKYIDEYVLEDPVATAETYKQIRFSQKDTSVVYVMTTNNLYKKFKTRLTKSIGAFRLSDNSITSSEALSFCSVMQTSSSPYDYVFLGGNTTHGGVSGQVGKLYKFDETISYKSTSNDTYKRDLLALSAIKIQSSEYVTDFTINKSLNKMMFNHLIFRDSFSMKYTAAYDSMGRVQLTSVDYLLDGDNTLSTYTIPRDLYIGVNEPVFADNINKSFKIIYNLQESLLAMCAETVTNKFPFASQCIELK